MNVKEFVQNWSDYSKEPLVTFDGLDEAVIGVVQTHGTLTRVTYSFSKIIEILMNKGLDYEQALSYYANEIETLWVGENTPAVLYEE